MTNSSTVTATGLLLVFQTVPPQHDEEFRDWYGREHIPERQGIEGFVSIRRMDSMDQGQPRYMGIYELTSLAVLEKPEYVRLRKEGRTNWSIRMLERVSPARYICTAVQPIAADAIGRTRYVLALAGESSGQTVADLARWFDGIYAPALRKVDGVRLVRRFDSVGEPNKFVALIDLDHADVCSSDAYLECREQCGAERRFGRLRGFISKVYEQEKT
ncbi:MAG: hypothetical protein ACXWC0_08320 [Burkholderiales bacterium]